MIPSTFKVFHNNQLYLINMYPQNFQEIKFLGAAVRRVNMHPKEGSWVVSAINGNNEISMWDMETQSRHMTLWASPKPPLCMTQVLYPFLFSWLKQ